MTLPPQPVNAIVYTAAAHSANLWTAESARPAVAPVRLYRRTACRAAHIKSQGKRHDIIQLGGENLATGLNGEGLFLFAGDQKTLKRFTPTRCWLTCLR